MSMDSLTVAAPFPRRLSKYELYSSKHKFYIIGQEAPLDKYHIIKIDR